MANTKQAKKMIRKIKTRTARNKWLKSRVKDAMKNLDEILSQANVDSKKLQEEKIKFQKAVDKAAKRRAIHPNKASRLKSSLLKNKAKRS